MVAVLRKIIAAGTGQKAESRIPPLIEFYGPEMIEVVWVKIREGMGNLSRGPAVSI